MCEPMTIAMLAIAAVSAVGGMAQQDKQNKAIAAQTESANNALTLQQQQDNRRAAQEQAHRATQGAVERGAQSAAASEGNFIGNSTNSLFKESMFNEGSDLTALETNRSNRSEQIQREKEAGTMKSKSQMVSSGAMYTKAGLQIAGAGIDAYSSSAKAKV